MAKPEWGTKRTCPSCGVRFYDMQRDPLECPSCGASVPTDMVVRTRRGTTAKTVEVPAPQQAPETEKPAGEDGADDINVDDVAIDLEDDGDDDDSLMEDASDLNEGDDMPEIADHIETDEDNDS